MKLYYIANNQLPTFKAHGLQIMKTVEALVALGIPCELIVPERSLDPNLPTTDPFAFYDVKSFPLVTFRSFDSLRWAIPGMGKLSFWIQQILFAYKVKNYLHGKEGVVYSRDPFTLSALRSLEMPLYWEAHQLPGGINGWWYHRILNRLNGIITITHALKDAIQPYFHKEILVASDAVDLAEFPSVVGSEGKRGELHLPVDGKIAMYLGHLYSWKGIDTVIAAADYLESGITIVLVGGLDEDRARVSAMLTPKQHERIIFLPAVLHRKVGAYLASADCLLLTGNASKDIAAKYTSPLKLFEYLASGRPIVAQALPSFQEILNKRNALLVTPNDPQALAVGIMEACRNQSKAAERAQQGLRDVQSHTWQRRAQSIKEFIHV